MSLEFWAGALSLLALQGLGYFIYVSIKRRNERKRMLDRVIMPTAPQNPRDYPKPPSQ